MIVKCPACGDNSTQALLGDAWQCTACGHHFDPNTGEAVETSHDRELNANVPVGGPPDEPVDGWDHTGPYPTRVGGDDDDS